MTPIQPLGDQQLLAALGRLSEKKRNWLKQKAIEVSRQDGIEYGKLWLAHEVAKLQQTIRKEHNRYKDAIEHTREWSQKALEPLKGTLKKGVFSTLQGMHNFACALMFLQGLDYTKAHQHEFFCVAEAFYDHFGISKRTYYRHISDLMTSGLLDARGHCTTVHGQNRKDGTVYAIKLQPERGGNARLTFAALNHPNYRNLEEDIAQNRTYWSLAQSENGVLSSLGEILEWIHSQCRFPRVQDNNPRYFDRATSVGSGLEAVLDIKSGSRGTKMRRVHKAVEAIVLTFGDQHSRGFWWKLLLKAAELAERGGRDYTNGIMLALERERIGREEGFVRNPAAVFISRLQHSGVYHELQAQVTVG